MRVGAKVTINLSFSYEARMMKLSHCSQAANY